MSERKAERLLYSIIESAAHPDCAALCARHGLSELKFSMMRKAMSEMKRRPPALIVADFVYGYSNNYASVNISNLDIMLFSLQKYAPDARVIVLAERSEIAHAEQLNRIFPLAALLPYPVGEAELEPLFREV